MDQLIYIAVFSGGMLLYGAIVYYFFARHDMVRAKDSHVAQRNDALVRQVTVVTHQLAMLHRLRDLDAESASASRFAELVERSMSVPTKANKPVFDPSDQSDARQLRERLPRMIAQA
jgi:hypothetical protein